MIRTLINVSESPVYLEDFNGMTIAPGEEIDGLSLGEALFKSSADITLALLNKTLVLSDGQKEYMDNAAVELKSGWPLQTTKDGKTILTASDRPKDHFRHFTSRGDDIAGGKIGRGQQLMFNVGTDSTQVIDLRFLDASYVKDGQISFVGAEIGSFLHVEVVAAPGTPFQVPGNGNYDYNGANFVPNAGGTGMWKITNVETVINVFINEMLLLGSDRMPIESAEPFQFHPMYILRYKIHNTSTQNSLQCCITMGMYRPKTV